MTAVAVIGAGPAGSAIAGRLAAGCETALVGGPAPPQGSYGFVHTIGPHALRLATACGVGASHLCRSVLPIVETRAAWGGSRQRAAMLQCQPALAGIERSTFDALLAKAARRAGADVWADDVVRLARAPRGGGWTLGLRSGRSLEARIVVDAAGRGGRFARRFGARRRAVDRLVCWCTVLADVRDMPYGTLEIETAPDGWIHAAASGPDRRQFAYFGDGDATSMSTARPGWPEHFCEAPILERLRAHLAGARIVKMTAVTAYLDRVVLDGMVAVGDAAQTLDPLSSQGIAFAIEDALSAGDAIATALGGRVAALAEHERRRRENFSTFMLERQAYYRSSGRRNALFWDRRRTLAASNGLDAARSRPHG